MSDDEPDEVKHVIDVGASVSVSSKRGTGTRDQDEVSLELEGEDVEEIRAAASEYVGDIDDDTPLMQGIMQNLRSMNEFGQTADQ